LPRVILAWEAGAGRGHVLTLKAVAEALGAPEQIDAFLCRMDHADLLQGVCGSVFPGVTLGSYMEERKAHGSPPGATWGEFLGDIGFRDTAFLSERIAWWQNIFRTRRIGLVIGDYAPCALLAARALGLPTVGIGIGYGLPPATFETFPVMLPDIATCIYDEADTVARINAAIVPLGGQALTHLSDLYRYDDQLVMSPPVLDPYAQWRRKDDVLPTISGRPTSLAKADGKEIFVYFSTTEWESPDWPDAFAAVDLPLRIYSPTMPSEVADRLARCAHVTLLDKPAVADEIVSRSRLILHAGQHNTMCLALAAGLPQVAIPQQLEQQFNARQGEEMGILHRLSRPSLTKDQIIDVLRARFDDIACYERAQAAATQVRPFLEGDLHAIIRARVNAVMVR
jgi:hypothetical protein